MNKKISIFLITFFSSVIAPVYAYSMSKELKTVAIIFGKVSLLVFVSILVILLLLLIYKKIKMQPYPKYNNDKKSCDIDDTETIDEAINTFLNVNKH